MMIYVEYQRAASFKVGLGGLPACTREVGGTQVSLLTPVSIPVEGIRRWGAQAGQVSSGNVFLLVMLR